MGDNKPTEHILKTFANYWDAIEAGAKNFEVRRDDRGFQKGDTLILRRMRFDAPDASDIDGAGKYKDIRKRVSYVLTGGQLGIEPGYVVMGLAND